jgi:HTH-type transcriptional regulator/antitoxin HigA
MEARGINQSQLAADVGIANSTISEVLASKRRLNRKQIVTLAQYFHIDPGAFLT